MLSLELQLARLRHAPLRTAVVAAGVALAVAIPLAAAGGAAVVAGRAVEQAVAALPAAQRSLTVSYNGFLSGAELASADRLARTSLSRLSSGPLRRQLEFRRLVDPHAVPFALGATDDLASAVRVVSGRAPRGCTPDRCEVLLLPPGRAARAAVEPDTAALGVVVVGVAVRTDPLLLSGTFDPGNDVPLLVAADVVATARLSSLELFQRSFGWVAPLDLGQVRRDGARAYVRESARVADGLSAARIGLVLTAPDAVIASEETRAAVAARRSNVLAGSTAALLLCFALTGAVSVRRDAQALAGLLRRRGARRRRVVAMAVLEAAVPVLAGAVAGIALALAASAVLAAGSGVPAGALHSMVSSKAAWVSAACLALAAWSVVAAVLLSRASGSRAWRWVDAALVTLAAVLLVTVARGGVSPAAVAQGNDPLLAVLPAVTALAAGLVAARVWPPLVSALARLLPRRWFLARLSLSSARRRPLRAVTTVAAVAAALTAVVFASSYRDTLAQGAADQAAFLVPLDARVTPGSGNERPLDVASAMTFAAEVPGSVAYPVVRASARVRTAAGDTAAVPMLGVDPRALAAVHQWGATGAPMPPGVAARALTPASSVRPGVALPAGRTVTMSARGAAPLSLTMWLRDPDGRETPVSLRRAGDSLVGTLPTDARGAALYALVVREDPDAATRRQHTTGEGSTDLPAPVGTLLLGRPVVDGSPLPAGWTGWASDGARVASSGSALRVAYRLTGAPVVVSAARPVPDPLPVLVDPQTATAADGGRLVLTLAGGGSVPATVVGVLPTFPTTTGARFAVAASAALAAVLDAEEPGAGETTELWLSVPPGDKAQEQLVAASTAAPFDRTSVLLRAERQSRLAADPVAVGASDLLAVGAGASLLVGLAAVVLLVAGDRRDDAAELFAWETDGLRPAQLRRLLALRAVWVLVAAVPVGTLAGLLLTRATTDLVALTALGTLPRPPLRLSADPGEVAVLVVGAVLVALAGAVAVAAGTLREPLPRHELGDLG